MSQMFTESIRMSPSHAASCAKTDQLAPDTYAHYRFAGVLHDALRFTKEKQLMSTEHWTRFVRQFRIDADAPSRGWRGEYWGKMMRGACFVCATTRDAELEAVLRQTVEDMFTAADNRVMRAISEMINGSGMSSMKPGLASAMGWTYIGVILVVIVLVALLMKSVVFYQSRD